MTQPNPHKAGFVSIVGKPNVGKSTLMNSLLGEKLSIVTAKAQTTRHRIMGFINGDDYQIIYSDTPGIMEPKYELHQSMMTFVSASLEDADVILYVTDVNEKEEDQAIIERLKRIQTPKIILLNKIDLTSQEALSAKIEFWKTTGLSETILAVSALRAFNTQAVFDRILSLIPLHPPYFDKNDLTDKPERFFASEMIREKIFINYKEEIPYSCEVGINSFQEKEDIIVIFAEIFVERNSQKGILIGEGGKAIKRIGIQARREMEKFFGKKVFLETQVKVAEGWRSNPGILRKFGYDQT